MTRSARAQGWFVLIAGAVGVFMTTPGQTVGVSAFVDPIAPSPPQLRNVTGPRYFDNTRNIVDNDTAV